MVIMMYLFEITMYIHCLTVMIPAVLPSLCVTQMENIIAGIKDTNLKLTLAFGIGIHHAGLHERDRKSVEELFVNQKIQVGYNGKGACIAISNSL